MVTVLLVIVYITLIVRREWVELEFNNIIQLYIKKKDYGRRMSVSL